MNAECYLNDTWMSFEGMGLNVKVSHRNPLYDSTPVKILTRTIYKM